MSKLLENECLSCSTCESTVKELLFCKGLKEKDSHEGGFPITLRCSRVVCHLCEFCTSCQYDINSLKQSLKSHTNNLNSKNRQRWIDDYSNRLKTRFGINCL